MPLDDESKNNDEEKYERFYKHGKYDDSDDENLEDFLKRNSEKYDEESKSDKLEGEEIEEEEVESFFSDEDFELKDFEEYEYGIEDIKGARIAKIKAKKRKRKMIFSSIAIMVILVLVAIGIVFGYRFIKNKYFSKTSTTDTVEESIVVPGNIKLGKDINILFACANDNLTEPEINTVIFSSYNSKNEELISLCIPVNTIFEIPGFGLDTVDKTVEYGGMDLMKLTLKNNIGMDVQNYILLDVLNIVNKLEGIKINLEKEITIVGQDNASFKLKEGDNILNGETALSFLSNFNGTKEDIEKSDIIMQKILIDGILKKIIGTKEGDLTKNLSIINDYIETDLNLEELSEVILTFASLSSQNNKTYGLDGRFEPFDENTIVFVPDISRISTIFNKEEATQESSATDVGTDKTASLIVLNGVGTKGIAGKTSDLLKSLKFPNGNPVYQVDVPGDADNYNYERTQIIIKTEDENIKKSAEFLVKAILVGNIILSENSSQKNDIVVIIGKDFNYDKAAESVAQLKALLQESETYGTSEEQAESTAVESQTTEQKDTQSGSSAQIPEGQTYDINILNGEGTQGIAITVKGIIEKALNKNAKVINVKETKNADSFNYNVTKILIHTEKEGVQIVADQIKKILGVGAISQSSNNPDNVDITLIIGSDYTK